MHCLRPALQVVGVQLSVKSTTRCVQQVLQAKNLCNIWRIGCVLPDRRTHTPSRTSNASQNRSCSCSREPAACSSGGSRIATFQDFSKNQVADCKSCWPVSRGVCCLGFTAFESLFQFASEGTDKLANWCQTAWDAGKAARCPV